MRPLLHCLLFQIVCLQPTADVATEDVAALIALLQSDDSKERYDAARSLRKLGPKAEPAIASLIRALGDSGSPVLPEGMYFGPRVQDAASEALVRIGQPAIPSLIEALRHKGTSTRQFAARTLGELGPHAKDAFPALATAMDDPEAEVRWDVIRAIGKVGAEPKVVVPLLKGTFRRPEEDSFNRAIALEAMHDADPEATMVIPFLAERLKDSDGKIMASAARTLSKYGGKAQDAVAALNEALSTEKNRFDVYHDFGFHVPVRRDVVCALADVGPAAATAVRALDRIMDQDEDAITRIWAASALVRIAPNTPTAERGFALLIQALRDEDGGRDTAAEALGSTGGEAAISAPIQALQQPDTSQFGTFRESVAAALGKIGPPAKAAVPVLRAALLQQDYLHFGLRREAAIALGSIGAASKPAIPDLASLSNSPDETLRDLAAEAIEKINQQLVKGGNSIEEASKSPNAK